ncbi:unnamed protein product [Spirodela intermedia]|uniref:protein-serine/threonine phosphatase n=1 Tax=Spirodela intermedia TaxID=51605 RepID=A0A7I8IQH1_SPIIN|nr:unnamed protein product [Spirodela intermedia]CAA6660031.1 unnamed protein product [Spirodela intermedia]
MRVAVSHRLPVETLENETLGARVATQGTMPLAVEGEISSDSVEEISEEDFKRQKSPRRPSVRSRRSRMGDEQQYSILQRNYASNLYNFAWARAVQNKPRATFIPEKGTPEVKVRRASVRQQACYVVDSGESNGPMEKEEGELEEGEKEVVDEVASCVSDITDEKVLSLPSEEDGETELAEDIDTQVASVLEELEMVSEEDPEKSLHSCCSRLQKIFNNLQRMMSRNQLPVLDSLLQQAVAGIQAVHSASMKKKDQEKDPLARLLSWVKNQISVLFTDGQMEKINEMIQSVVLDAVEKEIDGNSQLKSTSLLPNTNDCQRNDDHFVTRSPKLELYLYPQTRVYCRLLLDPLVDHDEDSLPSPTRENIPSSSYLKATHVSGPARELDQTRDAVVHTCGQDGITVTSYQEKYFHPSFLPSGNELPSPTPSEEGRDDAADSQGEVSSSNPSAARSSSSCAPFPHVVSGSSFANADSQDGQGKSLVRTIELGQGRGMKPIVKSLAQRRDPGLRLVNLETSSGLDCGKQIVSCVNSAGGNGFTAVPTENSSKVRVADELVAENHALKRRRNDLSKSRESGKGGWIVDNNVLVDQPSNSKQAIEDGETVRGKPEIGLADIAGGQIMNSTENVRNERAPSISNRPVLFLPVLLKDMAVNPTMLMQLMEQQQRLAAEAKQKVASLPPVTMQSSTTSRSRETELSVNVLASRVPTNQTNDGSIRMKPRDPRRILHCYRFQKGEVNGGHSINTQSKESLTTKEQGGQSLGASSPSQSTSLADIAKQFDKNLKNIANGASTPQVSGQTALPSQNVPQPVLAGGEDITTSSQPSTSAMAHETRKPQSCPSWGDVDHLLDGYDDQERATIQMERTRRIEEQNKMFAARKLCLVLDLDHTLLNSAKFLEIDSIHEDILRKREEQDQERPLRHLFRLPHMGMWTKLRPGIWNFLEKASKLYELHLYTMGNKLYATEMAKVLDPTGQLFAGRVISKGGDCDGFDGDERAPKSKDLEGVLGMESAVVVIDDSARVWPHHKLNLIVVERYTYFPNSRRRFGLLGPSLLEIDRDERPEDGTLASALAVIGRIHQIFFSHHCLSKIDTRTLLASEQRKILAGCCVVFSRIFPIGEVNPHLHPLWQMAEQFGAACSNQIDDQVTHVVANAPGTDKVNWALSKGRFVVHPGWVEASALLYRRAKEHDFAIKPNHS